MDEVDRKIKALEHQQQTTSMAVKDEKKILEEIKKLSANKPMIRQYDEARESLKGVSEHHATLYAQLKAKAAELEDDWGGLMKKKSKSKGGAGLDPAAPKTVAPKTVTLKHSPTDLSLWLKLELGAPADSSECPALHEKLLEKREWLKTAPPKPKPKKAEKPKEEEKAKEEDASKGVETDAPTAPPAAPAAPAAPAEEPAFDLKALKEQEAAEMKKKIEENGKKAKEKEKEEDARIARMQELEAQGVKVAGGMHKFDASEVDVHGGNATADDFLDDFGM